jgi:predicted dithiol-disulfide oxidoreductase (DUF899 family)
MDAKTDPLKPAAQVAAEGPVRIKNESAEYRRARTALLAEEIELRRHIARVAEQRRALPPGGRVEGDYRFMDEDGRELGFEDLFRDKETLGVYSYMFGPQREKPCPMCTNVLRAWDANGADIDQRMSLAVVARSPIDKLKAWKRQDGWEHLRLYTDLTGAYTADYAGSDEVPAFHVYTRRDGSVRHFWGGEMTSGDPGQDPRGAPDPGPLWALLDQTPEGRPPEWYPKLGY